MSETFTDYGEEWVQKLVKNSGVTLQIGLYADANGPDGGTIGDANDPSDASDLSDIDTEPAGSAYGRQDQPTSNFGVSLDTNDNMTLTGDTLTYDFSDSSREINAFFLVVSFQSDVVGSDGSETDHLMATGYLDDKYDLSQFNTTGDLEPAELTLD